MIRPTSLIARSIAILCTAALVNMAVPLGLPRFLKDVLPKGKPWVHPPQHRGVPKQSRPLSAREQERELGRQTSNPYLAGTMKWDVVYKGVNLISRNFTTSATDMTFEGGYGIPVNVTRSYSANNYEEGPLGRGWTLSTDIRNTAGGLLKSSGAPVRSVPAIFKMRPSTQSDPNLSSSTQPAEAVTSTDAGGKEETIQRDLDGVLTTPAWDTNVVDAHYATVIDAQGTHDVMDSCKVTTIDGTVYQYANEGYYDGGIKPFDDPNATAEPCYILKITSVTDRQGNVTTYSYGTGTATFQKSNGSAIESKLAYVEMPNGHRITFTWGDGSSGHPADRIWKISDNNNVRVVTYTYDDRTSNARNEHLVSVNQPSSYISGGFTTNYGYSESGHVWNGNGGQQHQDGAPDLLTSITDPRGLTTGIYYAMDWTLTLPYMTAGSSGHGTLWAPCVYKLMQPSGVVLFVDNQSRTFNRSNASPTGPTDFPGDFHGVYPVFQERIGDETGAVINAAHISGGYDSSNDWVLVWIRDWMQQHYVPNGGGGGNEDTYLHYMPTTQSLIEQDDTVFDFTEDYNNGSYPNLGRARFGNLLGDLGEKRIKTETTYNFMGSPLERKVTEMAADSESSSFAQVGQQKITQYAYWGMDKYGLQKAVRVKTGLDGSNNPVYRYSYTDYYDKNASAGQRGQTKAAYDPKNGGVYLNTSLPYPSGTPSGSIWRYQVDLGSSAIPAATFYDPSSPSTTGYDSKGRPTDVWKLQKITNGTPSYVHTATTYGADNDGSWGQASEVVEDQGGIGRTTQTLHYTSWGVADKVQDAAGHVFETAYDLNGSVQSVTRTDSGLNQAIVITSYGNSGISKGMPVSITDGLSGHSQSFTYQSSGNGLGQIAQVDDYDGSSNHLSQVNYSYTSAGDRQYATYWTPQSNVKWWYHDYVHIGLPTAARRAFQTLTLMKLNGSNWEADKEEFHYVYDSAGRLRVAAFAQTPASSSILSNGSYFGTDSGQWATSRARAMYEYDPAGRLTSLKHYWDHNLTDGTYTTDALQGETCTYSDYLGLKDHQTFLIQNSSDVHSFATDHVEHFGYDSALDQLTYASYDNDATNTQWSYDAAGNRNDVTAVDNLNRATTIGGVSRTYDILGNTLTIGSTKSMTWDCLNRMSTFTSGSTVTAYQYRADGMRVQKGNPNTPNVYTNYAYDGQMPIEEFNYRAAYNTFTFIKVIRYGLGARGIDRIEREQVSGTKLVGYPLYDAHGNNVATLVKGSGADTYSWPLGDQRLYDAWGNVRTGTTTGEPHPRHCANLGHLADDESGFVYMRARYYEPGVGRFISEDPELQRTNWYIYALNAPSYLGDRTGKDTVAEVSFSVNEANGLEVTNIEAVGLETLEIEGFQSGNELIVKIELAVAKRVGSFRIVEMMTLFRGWAAGQGIQGVFLGATAASPQGQKAIDALKKIIERMGDQGNLVHDGPPTWFYWLFGE